jgi:hypothetical protein
VRSIMDFTEGKLAADQVRLEAAREKAKRVFH